MSAPEVDREKVINHFADVLSAIKPFDWWGFVRKDFIEDAIILLKEHESVKPIVTTVEQRCGNCRKVIEMDGWIACPWCGKKIDWEMFWKGLSKVKHDDTD